MSTENPHNGNSNDEALSAAIEQANQKGLSNLKTDDPVGSDLETYRQIKKNRFNYQTSGKEHVWNAIDTSINPKKSSNILPFISNKIQIWTAAAVVIIGCALGIIYTQNFSSPELIAESESTITTISLEDGTSVTLRPNSKLYSLKSSSTNSELKLEGEGFFDVTKNANRTFAVQTQNGTVSVLGTRFNLSSWGNKMQVFLEEGSVNVQSNASDSSLTLVPGDAAKVSVNEAPKRIALNREETKDWLNNELVFNDKQVSIIVQELEQQFDVQINVANETANLLLSGRLSLENVNTTLFDLGLVLDGTFTQTPDNTYSFVRN